MTDRKHRPGILLSALSLLRCACRAPWWRRVLSMYRDGFRELEVGRRLWLIVIVKVAIIVTLALTLFPNYLNEAYDTDADRAAHVLDALTPAATEVAP